MEQLDRRRRHFTHCQSDEEYDLHRYIYYPILPNNERWDWWPCRSGEWLEEQGNGCFDHGNSKQWLQLRQLERQWHGILFWSDESIFNHNRQPHYRDRCFHAKCFSDAHADSNTVAQVFERVRLLRAESSLFWRCGGAFCAVRDIPHS